MLGRSSFGSRFENRNVFYRNFYLKIKIYFIIYLILNMNEWTKQYGQKAQMDQENWYDTFNRVSLGIFFSCMNNPDYYQG